MSMKMMMMSTKTKMMTSTATQSTWHWTQHDFRAMNTQVLVELLTNRADRQELVLDVERLFTSFERRLSRFEPSSELSQLNNASHYELVSVSPTLASAAEVALWGAAATGGVYDPTLLNELEWAGYDRSFEKMAKAAPLTSLVEPKVAENRILKYQTRSSTFRSVIVNRAQRQISKPIGLRLDLGGMGKGWTVDRATDILQGAGPFLINAGGDLFAYASPPRQIWLAYRN